MHNACPTLSDSDCGSVGLMDCPALSDCRTLSGIARFMNDYIDGLTDRGSWRIDTVPSSDDLALSAPRPVTNRSLFRITFE
eukprot:536854-Prymnesium_polylepis.1